MTQTTAKIPAIFILFICMSLFAQQSYAQGPPDPNDAPIDGGLSLLLAAGAAYGVKKYRDGRKKKLPSPHSRNDRDVPKGELWSKKFFV